MQGKQRIKGHSVLELSRGRPDYPAIPLPLRKLPSASLSVLSFLSHRPFLTTTLELSLSSYSLLLPHCDVILSFPQSPLNYNYNFHLKPALQCQPEVEATEARVTVVVTIVVEAVVEAEEVTVQAFEAGEVEEDEVEEDEVEGLP